jgi:hypothetical protein
MPKYPDFIKSTAYKVDGRGLHGFNCRHSFSPFYPGVTQPRYSEADRRKAVEANVTYTDRKGRKITTDVYKATQYQRELERNIRNIKLEIAAMEASNQAGGEVDIAASKSELKAAQKTMREFIKESGLRRQNSREQIARGE